MWSWDIFTKEVTFLDITDENREVIKNNLKKEGIRTWGLKRIGTGNGWHKHSLFLYYYLGETKTIYYGEGDTYLENVNMEDEYSLEDVSVCVGATSILTLLMIFIYEIKRKRK